LFQIEIADKSKNLVYQIQVTDMDHPWKLAEKIQEEFKLTKDARKAIYQKIVDNFVIEKEKRDQKALDVEIAR
jgi:hypothetical protein